MCSWGNRGYPSNYKAKPSFFQSVGRSGDCEVKRLFRMEYLHAEGQEVSGEHRFLLFGKTDASEGFALAVAGKSERPNNFFIFVCKSLKM